MKIYLIAILCIFLTNCSQEESDENPKTPEPEVTEEVYFTITPNLSDPDLKDFWIIIHDSEGNLLDHKNIIEEMDYEFATTDLKSINTLTVSLFYNRNILGDNFLSCDTFSYPNVAVGSHWYIPNPKETPQVTEKSPSIGTFNLTINNIPNVFAQIVQNGFEYYNPVYSMPNTTMASSVVKLYENDNYFITIWDGNNDTKYKFIDSMKDGESISLDYTGFDYFDSYIDVELPQSTTGVIYFVTAYDKTGNGTPYQHRYVLGTSISKLSDFPFTTAKMGYLNKFDRFLTEINVYVNGNDYHYSFKKLGEEPKAIVIPDKPSIMLENELIDKFRFTAGIEFDSYMASGFSPIGDSANREGRYEHYVFAKKDDNVVIGKMPNELKQKYPNIMFDDINSNNIDLYLTIGKYAESISNFSTLQQAYDFDYEDEYISVGLD